MPADSFLDFAEERPNEHLLGPLLLWRGPEVGTIYRPSVADLASDVLYSPNHRQANHDHDAKSHAFPAQMLLRFDSPSNPLRGEGEGGHQVMEGL